MVDEIVAIYAIVENLLKAIGHQEDCRIKNKKTSPGQIRFPDFGEVNNDSQVQKVAE